MNVRDTAYHGDRPMCQIWYANVKAHGNYGLDTKIRQKPIKFDIEVKDQCRIGIMNVRDT